MNKSLLIVALTLAGSHQAVFAQQASVEEEVNNTEDVRENVLIASGENPWAMSEPNTRYNASDPVQQPAPVIKRQRYITQEELEQLNRLPPERNYSGPQRNPLDAGGMPGRQNYYGQGYYPSSGYYGSRYGASPFYDPYGGSYTLPYGGGILPFLY